MKKALSLIGLCSLTLFGSIIQNPSVLISSDGSYISYPIKVNDKNNISFLYDKEKENFSMQCEKTELIRNHFYQNFSIENYLRYKMQQDQIVKFYFSKSNDSFTIKAGRILSLKPILIKELGTDGAIFKVNEDDIVLKNIPKIFSLNDVVSYTSINNKPISDDCIVSYRTQKLSANSYYNLTLEYDKYNVVGFLKFKNMLDDNIQHSDVTIVNKAVKSVHDEQFFKLNKKLNIRAKSEKTIPFFHKTGDIQYVSKYTDSFSSIIENNSGIGLFYDYIYIKHNENVTLPSGPVNIYQKIDGKKSLIGSSYFKFLKDKNELFFRYKENEKLSLVLGNKNSSYYDKYGKKVFDGEFTVKVKNNSNKAVNTIVEYNIPSYYVNFKVHNFSSNGDVSFINKDDALRYNLIVPANGEISFSNSYSFTSLLK